GRELYKAGRFAEAATKLEQATRDEPNNPKAWWQLNFAYNKLERYPDALRAAETAGRLDPTYGFASAPGKYDETVTRLRGKSGGRRQTSGAGRSAQRQETPFANRMSQQLTSRGVYIEPGMNADVERLAAVVRELRPVEVRFLIFSSTAGSAALSREADRVRKYLGLRDGYVIACSKAGLAASSTALNRDTLRDLTRQVAPQMEGGDYTGALERLARGLTATRRREVGRSRWTGGLVLGGGLGAVAAWILFRRMRHARAMKQRREAAEQRKSEIVAQMSYLEDSLGAAPEGLAGTVRQARLDAGAKLDEASRIIVRAKSEYDLTRAQALLEQAVAHIEQGRNALDGRPAGRTGRLTGPDVPPVYAEAAQASGRDTEWGSVPEAERGVCFFCSRPSLLDELTAVTVNVGGDQRRVLACADDYQAITTGEPPRIRAFDRGGRTVPWYAADDYDPYRDYYSRGYDNRSLVSDLVTLSVIDSMFWSWRQPAWGWGWGGGYGSGWGGYTFWPEHHHYHDYHSERAASHAFDP
ncbi:MAG: tetratricopeptide repeat protein, partial [Armatimonadetes bacterium]|nr:tetratricopeptide repeat protein [Armatimonadota bacterium]